MEDGLDGEISICPRCGGQKPGRNRQKGISCECTCMDCTDCKEYD
ncbi:MAG: hypothetical protein WC506_04345 [Candidatus Micrarchaeia archaeon]